MNEHEWLIATDPAALLDYLDGKTSERKLRLFACGCVRRYWEKLRFHSGAEGGASRDEMHASRQAVLVAERYAEGEADDTELENARNNAEAAVWNAPQFDQPTYQAAHAATLEPAIEAGRQAREFARLQAVREAAYEVPPGWSEAQHNAAESARECRMQAELVREVFGNPFRPVKIDPVWLHCNDGAVEAILQTVWQEQRFSEMPYLADALLDAGCAAEALLRHLREPGRHVRGCWAIDALLGRG